MNKQNFSNKIVIIGLGIVSQTVLPLLFRYLNLVPSQVIIITADKKGTNIAKNYGINPIVISITQDNYQEVLKKYLNTSDILLNLSVNISSLALIKYCQEIQALYLDTCVEPWAEGYCTSINLSNCSNYSLREEVLSLKSDYQNSSTALIAHGANPGLVSHFVKQAIVQISKDQSIHYSIPNNKEEWAKFAKYLDIKVIHISEQDTQDSFCIKKSQEFVGTWSIDGFFSEACLQLSELGWGTHEKYFPTDANKHKYGCQSAIYLGQPGLNTTVKSWAPKAGPFLGFLITHHEAISLSDYFTLREDNKIIYRPTVHYSYNPCPDTLLSIHELIGNNMQKPLSKRLLCEEITQGMDELGVLLMGPKYGSYWYGSHLEIKEARSLVPHGNATSLQVAAGVLAGLIWVIENPKCGIVEAEDLNYERVLEIASPFLGKVGGFYTDWTPLKNRSSLFVDKVDTEDPWQFINFRIT